MDKFLEWLGIVLYCIVLLVVVVLGGALMLGIFAQALHILIQLAAWGLVLAGICLAVALVMICVFGPFIWLKQWLAKTPRVKPRDLPPENPPPPSLPLSRSKARSTSGTDFIKSLGIILVASAALIGVLAGGPIAIALAVLVLGFAGSIWLIRYMEKD